MSDKDRATLYNLVDEVADMISRGKAVCITITKSATLNEPLITVALHEDGKAELSDLWMPGSEYFDTPQPLWDKLKEWDE